MSNLRLHSPTLRHGSSRAGFSLTDLVVAMALIAVIATIAVPAFFNRSEVTLENAAILLARDLRTAQNRAAYIASDVYVGFDEGGDGYWISDAEDAPEGGTPYLIRSYSENAVFEGVVISDVALGEGPYLVYGARGIARTGARITLRYQRDVRVVIVESETGRLLLAGSTSGFEDNGF